MTDALMIITEDGVAPSRSILPPPQKKTLSSLPPVSKLTEEPTNHAKPLILNMKACWNNVTRLKPYQKYEM